MSPGESGETKLLDEVSASGAVGSLPGVAGEAPVEHEHLAELAEHDVGSFQVAMNHAARMGERDGITDADRGFHQCAKLDRAGPVGVAVLMVGLCRFGQRSSLHEPHDVIERIGHGTPAQLVNRDDARVLQAAVSRALRRNRERTPESCARAGRISLSATSRSSSRS